MKKGEKMSEKSKRKMRLAKLKNPIRYWLGKKRPNLHSEKHKEDLRKKIGTKAANWKGDDVGYHGVHYWIKQIFGNPRYCEHCKRTDKKKYQWANKDHKYRRRKKD